LRQIYGKKLARRAEEGVKKKGKEEGEREVAKEKRGREIGRGLIYGWKTRREEE